MDAFCQLWSCAAVVQSATALLCSAAEQNGTKSSPSSTARLSPCPPSATTASAHMLCRDFPRFSASEMRRNVPQEKLSLPLATATIPSLNSVPGRINGGEESTAAVMGKGYSCEPCSLPQAGPSVRSAEISIGSNLMSTEGSNLSRCQISLPLSTTLSTITQSSPRSVNGYAADNGTSLYAMNRTPGMRMLPLALPSTSVTHFQNNTENGMSKVDPSSGKWFTLPLDSLSSHAIDGSVADGGSDSAPSWRMKLNVPPGSKIALPLAASAPPSTAANARTVSPRFSEPSEPVQDTIFTLTRNENTEVKLATALVSVDSPSIQALENSPLNSNITSRTTTSIRGLVAPAHHLFKCSKRLSRALEELELAVDLVQAKKAQLPFRNHGDPVENQAKHLFREVMRSWQQLDLLLPSDRLSEYLREGGLTRAAVAVPLAKRLLRLIEDLYLLCARNSDYAEDCEETKHDPGDEQRRWNRLRTLFPDTPEKLQKRFDFLRSCQTDAPNTKEPRQVEELLISLQATAPSAESFCNTFCCSLFVDNNQMGKIETSDCLRCLNIGHTGILVGEDSTPRLLQALVAPLAHSFAWYNAPPPTPAIPAEETEIVVREPPLISMVLVPIITLKNRDTRLQRKHTKYTHGVIPAPSQSSAEKNAKPAEDLPVDPHLDGITQEIPMKPEKQPAQPPPENLALKAKYGHSITCIPRQNVSGCGVLTHCVDTSEDHSWVFHQCAPGNQPKGASSYESNISKNSENKKEDQQQMSNVACSGASISNLSVDLLSLESPLLPIQSVDLKPFKPETMTSTLMDTNRKTDSTLVDKDTAHSLSLVQHFKNSATKLTTTISSARVVPGASCTMPFDSTTSDSIVKSTRAFGNSPGPRPRVSPLRHTEAAQEDREEPPNDWALLRRISGAQRNLKQAEPVLDTIQEPPCPTERTHEEKTTSASAMKNPPRHSTTREDTIDLEIQTVNASAEWLLGLRVRDGLSRFHLFTPAKKVDEAQKSLGSVVWYQQIAASLPWNQRTSGESAAAAGVEQLKQEETLEEVTACSQEGNSEALEDLLTAMWRYARRSTNSVLPLHDISCISVPVIVIDKKSGAFYGVDAYAWTVRILGEGVEGTYKQEERIAMLFRYVLHPPVPCTLSIARPSPPPVLTSPPQMVSPRTKKLKDQAATDGYSNMRATSTASKVQSNRNEDLPCSTAQATEMENFSEMMNPSEDETNRILSCNSPGLCCSSAHALQVHPSEWSNGKWSSRRRSRFSNCCATEQLLLGGSFADTDSGYPGLVCLSSVKNASFESSDPNTNNALTKLNAVKTGSSVMGSFNSTIRYHRRVMSPNQIAQYATLMSRGNEVNDMTIIRLQKRLMMSKCVLGVYVSSQLPSVVYINDTLMDFVVQCVLNLDEEQQDARLSSEFYIFLSPYRSHIVLDLVPSSRAPADENERVTYQQSIYQFYLDSGLQHQLLSPVPPPAASAFVAEPPKLTPTAPSWIDEILLRSMLQPPSSTASRHQTRQPLNPTFTPSEVYATPQSCQPCFSHTVEQSSQQVPLSQDDFIPCTPSSSFAEPPLPEVWAVQVGTTLEEKSLIHPRWYLTDQLREMLVATGAAVVATGCGAATVAFPFITQEKLDLVKKLNIVHQPLSMVMDLGIMAVNEMAEGALSMLSTQERQKRENKIFSLGYKTVSKFSPSDDMVADGTLFSADALGLQANGNQRKEVEALSSVADSSTSNHLELRYNQDFDGTDFLGNPGMVSLLKFAKPLSGSDDNDDVSDENQAMNPNKLLFDLKSAPRQSRTFRYESDAPMTKVSMNSSESKFDAPSYSSPTTATAPSTANQIYVSKTKAFASMGKQRTLRSGSTSTTYHTDKYPTLKGDADVSFVDYCVLPKTTQLNPERIDFPDCRCLVLYSTPCYHFLQWLISLGHGVTYMNNVAQISGALQCQFEMYEFVFIEWSAAIMTPDNLVLLKQALEDNFSTSIFFCVIGAGVDVDAIYPDHFPENLPPLPSLVSSTHVFYSTDMYTAVLTKRPFIRNEVRLGRLLKMLKGNNSMLYQITRLIGSGGFGDVYEVSFYASKGKLAMKRIPLGVVTLERMEYLYKEVAIMRELDHRNIVQISHVNCDKVYLNIFMELCDCTLEEVMKAGLENESTKSSNLSLHPSGNAPSSASSGVPGSQVLSKLASSGIQTSTAPLSSASHVVAATSTNSKANEIRFRRYRRLEASLVIRDVVSAVKYLHCFHIVHRDIKPLNILMADGVAKLADFGSATTVTDEHSGLRAMKGTVPYMAPEVFLSESYRTPCDIWSLGILFAEMLGLHLAHFSLLHFPALQEFYKSLSFDDSMPVVATNFVNDNICKNLPSFLTTEVESTLQKAVQMAREEQQSQRCSSRYVSSFKDSRSPSRRMSEVSVERHTVGSVPCVSSSKSHRTIFAIEVDSQRMTCRTTQHLLPGSLMELFESTFQRCPERRITAEELQDHPVVNSIEWLQRMFVEVDLLNRRIGTNSDMEEASKLHMDLTISQLSNTSSGDDVL